ncbi:hypothetical protein, partial [Ruminococcus bicirculans (ex Wegman et al. 2014)]|uniref:hypothetical protein n=1 Tax=Ruminococcus bicirculans (ex Wegman et al. 2014) TaxID=1160721 RepID=UPI003FD7D755
FNIFTTILYFSRNHQSGHFLYPLINEAYKPLKGFIALHLFEITPIFQYVIKQINSILIADTTIASIIRNGVE